MIAGVHEQAETAIPVSEDILKRDVLKNLH